MNVSQFVPDERMEHEAIGSIDALASVKETLQRAGVSAASAEGRQAGKAPCATGVAAAGADGVASAQPDSVQATAEVVLTGKLEAGGALFDYAIDAFGNATIVRCTSKAERVNVPASVEGYPVRAIGHHAFSSCYSLRDVSLPTCVLEIREHAFMNTALQSFEAPCDLEVIGQRAFFKCEQLVGVGFNDGLRAIGAGAFRESAVACANIPASVSQIGREAFKGTPALRRVGAGLHDVTACEPGDDRPASAFSGFKISPDNPYLALEGGALYRIGEGEPKRGGENVLEDTRRGSRENGRERSSGDGGESGLVLVELLDEHAMEFACLPGTTRIADYALSGKKALRHVRLPEGVVALGEAAFKGCASLRSIVLPDSLESIGRHAFWGTALESVHIPAGLREAGTAAFYTGDTVPRRFVPTIREVTIAPGNECFYIESDVLCQRLPDGSGQALLYFGSSPCAEVPRSVSSVGPYAYLNRQNVKRLTLYDTLGAVDVAALDFGRAVPTIIYETTGADPRRYVVEYPPGEVGRQTMCLTFGLGRFDIDVAFAECDEAILSTRDAYVRYRMMARRLAEPVCMTVGMAAKFRARFGSHVAEAVVAFGRNGYLQGIDLLCDLGILDADNIQRAVDAAVAAGEVAAASRLMEAQRAMLGRPLFDFDL